MIVFVEELEIIEKEDIFESEAIEEVCYTAYIAELQ